MPQTPRPAIRVQSLSRRSDSSFHPFVSLGGLIIQRRHVPDGAVDIDPHATALLRDRYLVFYGEPSPVFASPSVRHRLVRAVTPGEALMPRTRPFARLVLIPPPAAGTLGRDVILDELQGNLNVGLDQAADINDQVSIRGHHFQVVCTAAGPPALVLVSPVALRG